MSVGERVCSERLDRSVHRLAVLRPAGLSGLLDAVPALRALRAGFSAAEITLVAGPRAADFAHRFGHYVDRFVPFYGFPDPRDQSVGAFSSRPVQGRPGDDRYDLVVQLLDGRDQSNAWARALGGRMTAGFFRERPPEFLTLAVSYPEEKGEVERLLHLTRLLGCPSGDETLEFPLFLEDHAEARRTLSRFSGSSAPSVMLHVPSDEGVDHAAAVAEAMMAGEGCRVIVMGESALPVASRLRVRPAVVASPLSPGGLAAAFSRMDLVITSDPHALRLAQAVGVEALALQANRVPVAYVAEMGAALARSAAG